ncbi:MULTISPECIES: carbohydrate ABC transporter permease [Vibrio]|uniref:carbohydrate ABC transporter permease n=1 Tax=Vibrio TaxID=662 RepID=UPI0020761C32|nr:MULTISPECIES: carbohydrate ABC transporter permease [Vibrio]USD35068.1 carbohydrate ABC transporter permease [Vibrio sp. SCSIO 43186]USD48134.1 carbohydrate ABC transporter permease [Vibrio sp. SCSIO 43145]USD72193.1 carbohydrate ABC transporter permease [Vibrio sp. SCSIO 43139]USD98795.1 sugar ABC transporter permease [Vibrio coralliilyticus]
MKSKSRGVFVVTLVLALIYVFPFAILIINSLKTKFEILKNPLALPTEFNFDNFVEAFVRMDFLSAVSNSLYITLLGLVVLTVFPAMLAYYLEREPSKFKNIIFYVLVGSMIIPFQAVMIPFVSLFGKIGFLNGKVPLVYFYLGFGVALSTFMYRSFIAKIPKSLDESGAIEGASKFTVFWKIIFPQLKPITATMLVLNALWLWNDYLLPSLTLHQDDRTLPLMTYSFFGKYTSNYGLAMAGLVLSIVPIIIFYLIMQRQIVSGITDGAVK